jgi:hypothetical protein
MDKATDCTSNLTLTRLRDEVFGAATTHKSMTGMARNTVFHITLCLAACLALNNASAQTNTARRIDPFSTDAERCIVPASQHHGVNYHVLRAILVAESKLRSQTVTRNTNGSIDVGMAGTNSIHFKELSKFGIAPEHLLDACISTYVAAWQLRKNIVAHGNTWEAVARYHSHTPTFNKRYQIILKNELIRAGVMTGTIQAVPGLQVSSLARQNSPSSTGVLVTDTQ